MDIPIIGREAKVVYWYPTTILFCGCVDPPQIQMIIVTGFGNVVACGRCNEQYVVTGVKPNGNGGLEMVVEKYLPLPPGLKPQ